MLVPVTDIEKVLEKYDHDLRSAGNHVYWLQNRASWFPVVFPVTNICKDDAENWNGQVQFEYSEVPYNGLRNIMGYNKNWRLFDFPPTDAELDLPWND